VTKSGALLLSLLLASSPALPKPQRVNVLARSDAPV